MAEKFKETKLHVNNRKTFVFMFGVLILFFAVSAFSIFGQFPAKAVTLDQSRFQDIAKQLADSRSPEKEKATSDNLKNLNPEEVTAVRKLWRDQLRGDKRLTAFQAKVFPELEKFDAYFYQKVEDRFGKGKNIFNTPKEQVLQLFNELSKNDPVVKLIITNVENTDTLSQKNNFLGIPSASAAGGDCEYVSSWPTWASAVWRDYYTDRPYSADRAKNDPNEMFCDFRLYITSRNYTEVDGLSLAAYWVVSYHGGLIGSANRDRYLVGYGSALIYGVPFEWYLRDYIIFRT